MLADLNLWAIIGFSLAAYSVVANDSVQTLGTFIASNRRVFKWYWLWLAAGAVLLFTLLHSWFLYDGDISHGRLEKLPFMTVQWYHAAAPLILVALTRYGIPVSTTFLVLSTFATGAVLEGIILKSVVGYSLAAVVAYVTWLGLSRIIHERSGKMKKQHRRYWRVAQWGTTGFLWYTWLAHDMANVAVFLPRKLSPELLFLASAVLLAWLGYIFYRQGGEIQKVVLEKTSSSYVRSATIIDAVYAIFLWYFKEMNNLPMSTTWVFVGLLSGRELAMATMQRGRYQLRNVFPIVGKDFLKILFGLSISIALVLIINNLLDGAQP